MSDVLDQSEVDALLAAVDSGQMAEPPPMQVFGVSGKIDVQVYDFKRPERVSKDQMRALEALHEGFGRNFGAALSGYLRTIIEVSVAHIEQLTYSEFIHSLPNPTCFNLLKAEQLDGQLCLEISPLIIYPIIDRLLGGSNADLFIPQRPLTQIEQRLVQRITDRATHHLSEAWTNLTPVNFSVQDFESNPQLVQIVPPNETVVVVGFELKMGNRAGTMSLCIPYNVIEPIMGKLSAQSWFTYQRKGGQEDHAKRLTSNLSNAPVELRAFLARTSITLSELMSLQVGDIITTVKPKDADVFLEIEGRHKFAGKFGQLRGSRAIQVTQVNEEVAEQTAPPWRPSMSQAVVGSDVRGEPISKDPVLGYFQRSELPLTSLLFILPMMVFYELGTRFIVSQPAGGGETRIIAFTLMREFFSLFGATGRYLPCLAVVGILLTWHIARNDHWRIHWGTFGGMLIESLVLALPILGLSYAVTQYIPPLAGTDGRSDPFSMLVLSIGAGIYEEAVFRLGAITLLNLLLVDALKFSRVLAFPLMVGLSALLFSGYHYLGSEPFHMQTFVFRTAAGLYFGGVFILRGFGVTAGCHAFYDIVVVLLALLVWR